MSQAVADDDTKSETSPAEQSDVTSLTTSTTPSVEEEGAAMMARGLLASGQPNPLKNVLELLEELRGCQQQLVKALGDEKERSAAQAPIIEQLAKTFDKVPLYERKCRAVVKQMQSISKRVAKLKTRTTALQAPS